MIRSIILKVASRCNIACTYCYEFSAGDQTWRNKPRFLSPGLARALGYRIREYCDSRQLATMNVVAHGGEPLMLGAARLDALFRELKEGADPVRLSLSLQTNGLLLNPEICDVLARHRVLIGVSLDGGPHQNRHRVNFKGKSTWTDAVSGIQLLREQYPEIWAGILCVVDLASDPSTTLDELCTFSPPQLDLLQPYTTHDMARGMQQETARRFGYWMREAMHHWLNTEDYAGVRIRVFEDALQASVSGRPKTDWFGERSVSYLVVETDGSYDMLDQLKIIGGGSAAYRSLSASIETMSMSQAEDIACSLLSEHGADQLPSDCKGCRWSQTCGGGHLTSRYSADRGFNNRSVYCEGIASLFESALETMTAYRERRT